MVAISFPWTSASRFWATAGGRWSPAVAAPFLGCRRKWFLGAAMGAPWERGRTWWMCWRCSTRMGSSERGTPDLIIVLQLCKTSRKGFVSCVWDKPRQCSLYTIQESELFCLSLEVWDIGYVSGHSTHSLFSTRAINLWESNSHSEVHCPKKHHYHHCFRWYFV